MCIKHVLLNYKSKIRSKYLLEGVQHRIGLEPLADGRSAHVTDLVAREAEIVQDPLELL